ncbi:MAG: zf-TFIIB domain-containing protein [Pseudomonadota bacterium]|nr:zf-TFIIB domain-containing protein [Pseudomonadota bacterium]
MKKCPRCEGDLLADDRCARCHGAWYDLGELEQAITSSTPKGTGVQATMPVRYLRCPVCETLMTPRVWERRSGVVVDVCQAHGAWLDGGELDRLREWTASARRARGPSADAEEQRLERAASGFGADASARAYVASDSSIASDLADFILGIFR